MKLSPHLTKSLSNFNTMKTPGKEISVIVGPEGAVFPGHIDEAGVEVHQVSVMASISSFSSRAINFLMASLGARFS